jgi:hypothetical protein
MLGVEGVLHILYKGGNNLTPISKGNVGITFFSLLQSRSKKHSSFVRGHTMPSKYTKKISLNAFHLENMFHQQQDPPLLKKLEV